MRHLFRKLHAARHHVVDAVLLDEGRVEEALHRGVEKLRIIVGKHVRVVGQHGEIGVRQVVEDLDRMFEADDVVSLETMRVGAVIWLSDLASMCGSDSRRALTFRKRLPSGVALASSGMAPTISFAMASVSG